MPQLPNLEPASPGRRVVGALALMGSVVAFGGIGLWVLGRGQWSLGAAIYMATITVSTVGFAELPNFEHVHGARLLTMIVVVMGIGAVAYFQSTLTALLVEGTVGHAFRRKRMKKEIDELSGHVVVAGIGSTGRYVAEELAATGTPFVVIDRSAEHLARLREELGGSMLYVHGDATEDHSLVAAGVERASGVIAALTTDKDNLFVTLSARSINPRARLVAKVIEAEAIPKMVRAGANATVSPNQIGGRRMASELMRPEVVEFLDQMLRDKNRNLRLEEVDIPASCPYVGKTLREVPIRREANVLVVAVRGLDRQFGYNPGPDHVIETGTVLVVLGATHDVQRLRAMIRGTGP